MKLSEVVHFTDKQLEATTAADNYDFVLYGGAAGGGKSYWLRWYPIRWLFKMFLENGIRGVRAGLFCEDYPSLKDRHLTKMQFEFPSWLGELKSSQVNGLSFTLREQFGGGTLALRNLDDPSKYFSSEFALIAVDELTKNHKETFDFLRFRKRWSGISRTKFIAGTNPGSIGHDWVKKKWIEGIHDENELERDQFRFVQSKVEDNPYLDKNYIRTLDSLPEKLKKAYRDGNWDVFEGQYFTEWDKLRHAVDPFAIPATWKKFRSIDPSGRSGITSCHWYALDGDGNVWAYREYYETGRDSDEHAAEISKLSEGEEYPYTVIDSAAFDKMGMPETTAEVYIRKGVNGLVPASKNRVQGWDFMHQYLRWDYKNAPKLKYFNTCRAAIRTIPNLVHDELHPEDVDSRSEDHAADEARYFLQTLREQKAPKPLSIVEQRLREMRRNSELDFSYTRRDN